MKRSFIFLILLFELTNCHIGDKNKFKESGLVLKAINKGSYHLDGEANSIYILVEAQLCNFTDSEYTFQTYNCTTYENIVTNTAEAVVCQNMCPHNGHIFLEVKPKEILTIPVILQVYKHSTIFDKEIKIGFIAINTWSYDKFKKTLLKGRNNKENIIWSNSFKLSILSGIPYEIR
jgi:hypothetical protein